MKLLKKYFHYLYIKINSNNKTEINKRNSKINYYHYDHIMNLITTIMIQLIYV